MQRSVAMAATHPNPYELHDHAGAKWLASASAGIAFAIITAFMMFVYPHM
jgi:hypothetical protein